MIFVALVIAILVGVIIAALIVGLAGTVWDWIETAYIRYQDDRILRGYPRTNIKDY